jgi:hypothetical protein
MHDPNLEPDLEDLSKIPTSPTMPTDPGIVHSAKAFSDGLTLDLTDDEITRALRIILEIRRKYSAIFRRKFAPHMAGAETTVARKAEEAMDLIGQFEDELRTTLAEKMDLLVSVDGEPVLFGEPPIISLDGALSSHSSAKYGLDHEKKEWEVKGAKELGQDFLGVTKLGE